MEQNIKLKTSDGKAIYGILRGSLNKPLIVQVHGLAGNMNEAMHYNAARYFEKHGFSSFRFNLYSWEKDARKLHECTFSTHGKDIDTVLKHLESKGAKRIFLVGHSFGLPSILHAKNRNFIAVAGWDGSRLPYPRTQFARHSNNPKGRILDEGYFVIMGDRMAEDSYQFNATDTIRKFNCPISFITVDNNVTGNMDRNKKMYAVAHAPKELVIIRGAHHNFAEEGKGEKLYFATVKWFKKML